MRNSYQTSVQNSLLGWKGVMLVGLLAGASVSHAQSPTLPHPYFGLKAMPAPGTPKAATSPSPNQQVAPITKSPVPGEGVTTNSLTNGQNDDVRLFPSNNSQTEVHISIDKTNPINLIASCNVVKSNGVSIGYYYSHDGGQTWAGSDFLPNSGQTEGDPATAYDSGGRAYLVGIASTGDSYRVQSSGDKGNNWTNQVTGASPLEFEFDKEMIAADNVPNSPYSNTLYTAWTIFGVGSSTTIKVNHSTDRLQAARGQSFSAPVTLVTPTAGHDTGTNVQTGPNGEVYVCWADYPTRSGAASGIGFARSTNGGNNFTVIPVAFTKAGIEVNGTSPDPLFNNTRVNDFPAMAVDKGTMHPGRIYIAYPAKENGNGKAIIQVRFSDNQGTSWSAPVTVSIAAGRQNWFPWIAVDDCTGDVSVIYYSFDTPSGFATNTYVAYSQDGGASFRNLKVSDAPHTPTAVSGANSGYAGDYIGITAYGGKAYPTWADNRTGNWQLYTSPVSYNSITGPDQVCSSSSTVPFRGPTAATNWSWSATPANLFTTSTAQGSQIVTAAAAGAQGTGTITATLPGGCAVLTKTVLVGPPLTPSFTYSESLAPCYGKDRIGNFATSNVQPFVDYTWDIVDLANNSVAMNGNGPTFYFSSAALYPGSFRVTMRASACGVTATTSRPLTIRDCGGGGALIAATVYPNPANETVTVEMPAEASSISITTTATTAMAVTVAKEPVFTVALYDQYGNQLKNSGELQKKSQLDVHDLPTGFYYLRISNETEVVYKQLKIIR